MSESEHRPDEVPEDQSPAHTPVDFDDEQSGSVFDQIKRERQEPHEGFRAGPWVSLFFLFCILWTWGVITLVKSSGGFRWDVYDRDFRPGGDAASVGGAVAFDPVRRGARVYRTHCSACHNANGSGVPGVYPPVAASDWVAKDPEILIRLILHGLAGEIVVNGNVYNGAAMNAFGDILSDRDVASVLTYVRQEWGNSAGPVDEAQVASARAASGSRSSPWSPKELLELFE